MDFKRITKLSLSAVVTAFLFAGCSNSSGVPAEETNPLATQVQGMWWSLVDSTGFNASGKKFTQIAHALQLNEDGSGYAVSLFFDDESNELIDAVGGKNFAPFTYTSTSKGEIIASYGKTDFYETDYFETWNLNYADSCIYVNDGKRTFQLERSSDAMTAMIRGWDYTANGGASAVNYNINDADFTRDNWRNQEAIYIWDGQVRINDQNRNDPNAYMLVNLPWYEGDKQTNLPNQFTDGLTPENGWEWVLNRCGSTAFPNNNFFAVYNKYMGILRFFYYLPSGVITGNDHVWQISMTDNLALHSLFGYGLPSTASVKDMSLLGPIGNGTMVNYVAPWVERKSDDGLIVPKDGWWAFDVDLSQYRPDTDVSKDIFYLLMRSWNTQHVSLHSTITASIDGSLKQKVKESKTSGSDVAKGVLIAGTAAVNIAAGIFFFQSQGADWVAKGLGSLAGALGCGKEFAGLFAPKSGPLEAEISLGLDGTIDTEGFIKGSATNIGVASPTLYLKDFILENSPSLGHGSWNIKKYPVVHVFKDIKYYGNDSENSSAYRFVNFPYFFDPSSIEVELNPDVFPENEIEWMQVDATCVGTNHAGVTGTDRYRTAFGLSSTYRGKSAANIMSMSYGSLIEHISGIARVYDFLSYGNAFDSGMEYMALIYNGVKDGKGQKFYGRGYKNGYAIEPMLLNGSGKGLFADADALLPADIYVPALEVNVIVSVKLKNRAEPITFSRNYLPEFNDISLSEADGILKKIKEHELNPKQKDHRASYDYQVKRLGGMLDWLQRLFNRDRCNPLCKKTT